jgi:hypothetical protein
VSGELANRVEESRAMMFDVIGEQQTRIPVDQLA